MSHILTFVLEVLTALKLCFGLLQHLCSCVKVDLKYFHIIYQLCGAQTQNGHSVDESDHWMTPTPKQNYI